MNRLGSLFVIASALGFATLGIFGKFSFELGWKSSDLLAWRMSLSALLVWLWIFPRGTWRIPFKQTIVPFLLGFVGYAIQTTLYFAALERLSVGILVLLLYVFPVFVTLIAWWIDKERPGPQAILAMALSLLGIGLTADFSGGVNLLGSLLAVGSALVYSVYMTISAKVTRVGDPIVSSGYIFLGAGISFTLIALLDGHLKIPHSAGDFGVILGISTIASVFPVLLLFWALRYVSTPRAAIISTLEPVFAILMGVLLLGERLTPIQLVGGALVLLAVLILQRK